MVVAMPVVMPMPMIVNMIMDMSIAVMVMGMTMPTHRPAIRPARRVQPRPSSLDGRPGGAPDLTARPLGRQFDLEPCKPRAQLAGAAGGEDLEGRAAREVAQIALGPPRVELGQQRQ